MYQGINILDKKSYALKFEEAQPEISVLKQETYILMLLKGPGIPSVISYGKKDRYNILVENLLGNSMEKIWKERNKRLNLKDTCMFAIQALERIEYVHKKNFLHRDIKPGNFLVGNPDNSQIYLIDFGNAKKFKSSRTGKHVQYNKNSYKLWHNYAMFNYKYAKFISMQNNKDDIEKDNMNKTNNKEILFATNAINGFKNSLFIGGKNKQKTFQDILRLLDIFFSVGNKTDSLLSLINETFQYIDIEVFINLMKYFLACHDCYL